MQKWVEESKLWNDEHLHDKLNIRYLEQGLIPVQLN